MGTAAPWQDALFQRLRAAVLAVDPDGVKRVLDDAQARAAVDEDAMLHLLYTPDEDRQTVLHALLLHSWKNEPAHGMFLNLDRPMRAVQVLDLLLEAGLSPSTSNGFWETLLNVALQAPECAMDQNVRLAMARRLVDAGGDVNAVAGDGSVLWAALQAIVPLGDPTSWGMERERRNGLATPGGEALIQALLERGATLTLPVMRTVPVSHDGTEDLGSVRYARPDGDVLLGALPDGSETVVLRAVRSRSMVALNHVLGLGADPAAMGMLRRGVPTAHVPRTPAMLAVEMGWDAGLDRVADALLARGALAQELQQGMWHSSAFEGLTGRQRLERRALEQAIAEEVPAVDSDVGPTDVVGDGRHARVAVNATETADTANEAGPRGLTGVVRRRRL